MPGYYFFVNLGLKKVGRKQTLARVQTLATFKTLPEFMKLTRSLQPCGFFNPECALFVPSKRTANLKNKTAGNTRISCRFIKNERFTSSQNNLVHHPRL